MRYLTRLALLVLVVTSGLARADTLDDRAKVWDQNALMCQGGGVAFPSKQSGDPKQPCNDGDMSLFNGLLCAAGDERGCVGVAEAQDPATGQWHRSPRLRALGKNDQGDATFSPDMAMGVELYLVTKNDKDRAWKWLMWIHNNVPCVQKVGDTCLLEGLPRFCAEVSGCTMGHGAAATLAATVNYLQKNAGLPDLPNGRLRGHLGSFSGWGPLIQVTDSWVNDAGFSRHLTAVAIMLLRKTSGQNASLDDAARRVSSKSPNNAFFTYVAEKSANTKVRDQTLARCPATMAALKQPLWQWQWERDDADRAWEHSSLWDCLFMYRLLR